MIRRPPRSTPLYSSAASDVYKRQVEHVEEDDRRRPHADVLGLEQDEHVARVADREQQGAGQQPAEGRRGRQRQAEGGASGLLPVLAIMLFVREHRSERVHAAVQAERQPLLLSLIHISEPTRRTPISYAVFCLKK